VNLRKIPYPPQSIDSFLRDSAWEGKGLGLYPLEGITADPAKAKAKIIERFDLQDRQTLKEVFQSQMGPQISALQQQNIDLLVEPNAFAVVTGQQIHVGLGPAYVLYKIASTIQWANNLKSKYPQDHFIPVFWMATEDHDVAEINHFDLHQERYQWDLAWNSAVGDMPTPTLASLFDWLVEKLGRNQEVIDRIESVRAMYLQPHATLATATASWVTSLFAEFGLLVLDPRDLRLKKQAKSLFEQSLFGQTLHSAFQQSTERLQTAQQTPPAHVGKSLVFWMDEHRRTRIEPQENGFQTADGAIQWTAEQMQAVINSDDIVHLSANVLLRPLYQQVVLPCIAYVGGPSEYLYWLQTAHAFEVANLTPPQLLHRKGGVILTPSQRKKLDRLGLTVEDCFKGVEAVKEQILQRIAGENVLLNQIEAAHEQLQEQLKSLYQWKSPLLSESKKEIDAFVKWQKKMGTAATEAYLQIQFSADTWQFAAQLIASQFSVSAPQERTLHWVQYWFLNGQDWISALCSSGDYSAEEGFFVMEL